MKNKIIFKGWITWGDFLILRKKIVSKIFFQRFFYKKSRKKLKFLKFVSVKKKIIQVLKMKNKN